MICPLCQGDKYQLTIIQTIHAEDIDGKVKVLEIFDEKQEALTCIRCSALLYLDSQGWRLNNYIDSGLYWDEELEKLRDKPKIRPIIKHEKSPFAHLTTEQLQAIIKELKNETK